MAVVLFHLTTRFAELFHPNPLPTVSVSKGFYGVNLFFIISGFVIFMTLEKTSRPLDFVVSRFSRLFPAYWIAIILTFTVTHLLGLPGFLVGPQTALANFLMLHGIFRVPHVDGVYWTLEVELLFYCGMFLLFRLRLLQKVHFALMALMALRLVYVVLERGWGIELPWTLSRLLILQYIAWFALGIAIYQFANHRHPGAWRWPLATSGCAIITLLVADSAFVGVLAVGLASTVLLAAEGRLGFLHYRLFVWLGAISYPLYLLHENIGWSVILKLQALGLSLDAAILGALFTSLALAHALTRWVEQPAMHWIRATYRRRTSKTP